MEWLKASLLWAIACAAGMALFFAATGEPASSGAAIGFVIGALAGPYFHFNERSDYEEDRSLREAVTSAPSIRVHGWLRHLDNGSTLEPAPGGPRFTSHGVTLPRRHEAIRWRDVDRVGTDSQSYRGVRTQRWVELQAGDDQARIECMKEDWADMFALVTELVRRAQTSPMSS
ncbi:MAG: hypothetical protein R2707_11885 [Acidimicrobiales bacterium]